MVSSTTSTRRRFKIHGAEKYDRRSRRRSHGGFTLVELLIGMAISGLLLAQVCSLWFYSSRSFIAQMNYVDLDQNSQRALDLLTRDIRQVKALTSFASNQVVFTDSDDQPLTFAFTNSMLIRTKGGVLTVLLKECDSFNFAIYQRNPVAGAYDQYPTADPGSCKLIEVRWNCSRKLFPTAPSTTESMQSAKIVIRSNHP